MHNGMSRPERKHIPVGSKVELRHTLQLNGKISSLASRLIKLNIPSGVQGEVVGDGLIVGQRVVQLTLYSDNGIPVQIQCPVGESEIEFTNT